MLNDINLIPQTEVVEQRKTQAVKSSSVFSVLLLIVSLAVSVFYFVKLSDINKNIKKTDSEIESLRSKIKGMSAVEVSARNLDKKFSALESLFSKRSKYSLLLKEIYARKPSDVTIQNSDIKPGQFSISGTSESFISIANFVNNFLDKNYQDGNPDLKDMFIDVSLNNVSFDKSSNTAKFSIVVTYQDGRIQGL